MQARRRSSGHLTVRSNASKTPLIQVTIPNIPDDQKTETSGSEAQNEGVDNPAFHVESHTPTLTPQPNQPHGSPMFVFDPDCASLYSRMDGELSRRGSSAVESATLRTPVSSFGGGTPLNANSDKSSLTVPTIVTSKLQSFASPCSAPNPFMPRGLVYHNSLDRFISI